MASVRIAWRNSGPAGRVDDGSETAHTALALAGTCVTLGLIKRGRDEAAAPHPDPYTKPARGRRGGTRRTRRYNRDQT